MAKVAIKLYGREYLVNCDPGEEDRLKDVVKLVESKMNKVTERAGSSITDTRLFMLTCLGLADELQDARRNAEQFQRQDEDIMVAAVEHLHARIAHIASTVSRA
jgi:cell division protein ZapA